MKIIIFIAETISGVENRIKKKNSKAFENIIRIKVIIKNQ